MSNVIQEVVFPGSGLNTDDALEYIANGDSPYRLNVLISGNEAYGIITNMLGNELAIDIADHQLNLSLTYVTVASYYNRLTRKAYYWVYSQPYDSGGGAYLYDNRLFQYNEDLKTLDLIFIDTKNWFGIDLKSPFKDSSMIGDWLFFNPRVSEPKMIDIVRAYNYTNYTAYNSASAYLYGAKVTFYGGLFLATAGVSAGQTPITNPTKWERIGDSYRSESDIAFDFEFEYAFNVLKMPPVERPVISYGSDTHININNVRGRVFRFSYRYKYFDNTYSSYSAFSDISLPIDDEVYNGEILNDPTVNNYIKVAFNAHSPALVKEIEVVVQEVSGDWKRVKIINRQEQAELTTFDMSFNFYNNESYITVTNVEVAKIIDYVPQRANSMEIINKNILAYGGCLEGFDNVPKDEIRVGLTPVLNAVPTSSIPGSTLKDVYNSYPYLITKVYPTPPASSPIGMRIDVGSWYPSGVVDGTQLIVTIDGKKVSHFFTGGENSSKANYLLVVTNFISDNFPAYHVSNTGNYVYMMSLVGSTHFADISQFLFCTVGSASVELSKVRGFKTGANHPFCIYYYDENMRRWDAQVSKENLHIFGLEMHGTTVYVPMLNEVSPPPSSTAYRWTIDWEVYHLPPAGAKYWRWGYAGNSLASQFVQYIVSDIVASVPAEGENMVKIDITPLQTLKTVVTASWNQYPSSTIDAYTWQAGDRIRFLTVKSVPGAGTKEGALIDGVYEYEILKQNDTDNTIFTQYFDFGSLGVGENTLVEIYSPIKSISDTKTIYTEFGDIMPIIEDSAGIMVHSGQSGLHNQDTALSHTAMGSFDSGDIYHIARTPSKPIDTTTTTKGFFHESMAYSDFYVSDDFDRGKIGFETSFGQRFLNIVRYSRPYFQNTEINGLSTFEEDDANGWAGYKEYNDIFGDIVSIYEQGDTLKVYQERKASSTLIGRTEYMDSSGQTTVAISTVVLGAIRYSASNYSTVFPESISRNNRNVYGFDIYNGVVWRDGVNGLFPISGRYAEAGGDADYKMQTYFKLKSKALMQSGIDHVSVLTVWDEEYKLLYVIFKDSVLQDNNETIVFHEPSNRWITFAELEQSGNDGGFDTPLVPAPYIIVKGFESGIGYTFNEATGFGHFDLGNGNGTTALVPITMGNLGVKISIPSPMMITSPNLSESPDGLTLGIGSPLIHVSSISLTSSSMIWTALQSGSSYGQTTTVTAIGGGRLWLRSLPSWITVASGHILSVGDNISNGDILIVYTNSTNGGELRTGFVMIEDDNSNIFSITVTQAAPIGDPIVIINTNPLDTSGLSIFTASGYVHTNTTALNITFNVHKPGRTIGQPYTMYYTTTRNGVADVFGEFDIRDSQDQTKQILISTVGQAGERIIVYLSGDDIGAPTGIVDANVNPTSPDFVAGISDVSVFVSSLEVANANLSFNAFEGGSGVSKYSVVTLIGGTQFYVRTLPTWLTVADSVLLTPLVLNGVVQVAGGVATLKVYPTVTNMGAQRVGMVLLEDDYGNSGVITVTQSGVQDNPNVSVLVNPSNPTGLTLANTRGTSVNGDTNINIIFVPNNTSVGYLTPFTLHYQIWKGISQVGAGDIYNVINQASNTKTLAMSVPAVAGDTITVYLNK